MATPVETVRLLIRDNGVAVAQEFTDPELQIFLDLTGEDIYMAASDACKAWANKLAKYVPVYKTTDGKSVDKKKMISALLELADKFEKLAGGDGVATAVARAPYLVDGVGRDWTNILDPEDVLLP